MKSHDVHPATIKLAICLVIVLTFVIIANASFDPLFATAPNAGAAQQAVAPRTKTPELSVTPSVEPRARSRTGLLAGQTGVDANTIALYHFDGDVSDATGKYNGAYAGNAYITSAGLYNGALYTDGAGSFVRVPVGGTWGTMSQGTVEAFVDFGAACSAAGSAFSILSLGADYGGASDLVQLDVSPALEFRVWGSDGKWHSANSGINACRYLAVTSGPMWPYETWRFHHVAGTWGPRGVEIWVDGVLHGVGTTDVGLVPPNDPYACNPQQQMGWPTEQGYAPNNAYPNCKTPVMAPFMTGTPVGDYWAGIPPFGYLLIGCDSAGSCFKGRIDEVRVSNTQRVFDWVVVPTSTPPPTQTPVNVSSAYVPDLYTLGLYHLNDSQPGRFSTAVLNEVNLAWDGQFTGNSALVQTGRFGAGLYLTGVPVADVPSVLEIPNLGSPGSGAIETWVNLGNNAGNFTLLDAVTDRGDGTFQDRMVLGVHSPKGNIGFGLDITGSWVWAESQIYPQDLTGGWHHLAGTWGARGMELWLDGKMCTRADYFGSIYNPLFRYRVGCDGKGQCANATFDEVRLSSVQRTFTRLNDPRLSSAASGNSPLLLFLPMIGLPPPRVPCSPM